MGDSYVFAVVRVSRAIGYVHFRKRMALRLKRSARRQYCTVSKEFRFFCVCGGARFWSHRVRALSRANGSPLEAQRREGKLYSLHRIQILVCLRWCAFLEPSGTCTFASEWLSA